MALLQEAQPPAIAKRARLALEGIYHAPPVPATATAHQEPLPAGALLGSRAQMAARRVRRLRATAQLNSQRNQRPQVHHLQTCLGQY